MYCINLDRRPDRWQRFTSNVDSIEWGFPSIHRIPATDGWQPDTPQWWGAGGGAWGCFDSHRRILRSCVLENVQSVLIFEDDALLPLDFGERMGTFIQYLPDDWECIYLGGQHQHTHKHRPVQINPAVVRPYNVNRTHAYAFRGEGITKTLAYLEDFEDWSKYPKDHVDHRLGRLHESRGIQVYAPTDWIVGQAANKSDIDGRTHKDRFWDAPKATKRSPNVIPPTKGIIRVGAWYPNLSVGGAEVWLRSLLRGLDPQKFHVSGVILDEGARPGGEVPFGNIPVDVDTRQLLESVDVMIVWDVKGNFKRVRHHFHGPVVCVSHGGCQWSRRMLTKLAPLSTHYTAVSEFCRKTYPVDLQDKVTVIPNGVDLCRVVPTAERWELRQLLGIRDHLAIGYVGRVSHEKDPLAVARAVQAIPNAVGVYCGPDGAKYETKIREMIGDRLRWVGYTDQVSDVYGALDCLLLTSPSEGFSLTVTEAWAGGIPVVASDVGAMQMYPGVSVIAPTGADGDTLKAAIYKAISPDRRNTIERVKLFAREYLSSEAMCENWGAYLTDVVENFTYTGRVPLKPPKRVFQPGTLRPVKIPRP